LEDPVKVALGTEAELTDYLLLVLFRTESENPVEVAHGTEAGLTDYLPLVSV
jgi:hypothetical protein